MLKISEKTILNNIIKEQYHHFPGTTQIVCCITLSNGVTVVGESNCINEEVFSILKGKEVALDNAIAKCWQIFGIILKDKLADKKLEFEDV